MLPVIEILDLQVSRAGRLVLHIPRLEIQEKETLAVIGPNGAGKSSLLLVLGRLIKIERGRLLYRGLEIQPSGELVYRRKIGLVLQEPLLLDGSVFDNVAAGLHFRGLPDRLVKPKVNHWLERLGISNLAKRPGRSLSGGEAQRVSLARAFVLDPEVLLLDEPFSSLDAPTRASLLDDFHTLVRSISMTTVLVTHDQDEALLLADRVAVLLDGRLAQVGIPAEVFNRPQNLDVARFVGVETVISGRVTGCRDGIVQVDANGRRFEGIGEVAVGREVYLCLRPEDITLSVKADPLVQIPSNRLTGRIERLTMQGALVHVTVNCGFQIASLVLRANFLETGLKAGDEVIASFNASAVHLIDR